MADLRPLALFIRKSSRPEITEDNISVISGKMTAFLSFTGDHVENQQQPEAQEPPQPP
jgi:hypothetical protein